MRRFSVIIRMIIGIQCCFLVATQAQDYKQILSGRWEDNSSTNETSFQWIVDSAEFAFLSIPQAKLTDSLPYNREKANDYKWLSNNILTYSKKLDKDPVKAKLYPVTHSLIRIDSVVKDLLYVSLSDVEWSEKNRDSIIKTGNDLNQYIGLRKVNYRKWDLKKEKNKAYFLGLWKDPKSTKTTAYQLFVQKGIMGFLKLDTVEQKEPTEIKPDKGYNYVWITGDILYYYKQEQTGVGPKDNNPNKYTLMRIDKVDLKTLEVTISSRPFNKSGIDYIKEENDFAQYFGDNKMTYSKIKLVEKKCEGTEVVKIGGKDVMVKKKPIIYLYPTQEQEVNVTLHFQGQLTHTYPKYNPQTGWNVMASPNGTLIDPKTQREYYALYWEGENNIPYTTDKGFVVKGEETATFLEEKCTQLGLNAKEQNEFIIYWLPLLEKNKYNFIHFSLEEYQAQAAMDITPKPDALIRVFMLYKALDAPQDAVPQDLGTMPTRKGFTVVEWGGAELGKAFNKVN